MFQLPDDTSNPEFGSSGPLNNSGLGKLVSFRCKTFLGPENDKVDNPELGRLKELRIM